MSSPLAGQKILLGVSGGIAAYKAAPLARRLIADGAEVRVVMTGGARAFVQPLTFQALTGNPVHVDLLDERAEAAMGHIELARWADRILVAPASANLMAALAHGFASDLLTTLCLATDAPLALAPAMNRLMWSHPATRANAALLAARGVRLIGPAAGAQACGETGDGRMVEPDDIADALAAHAAAGTAPGADGRAPTPGPDLGPASDPTGGDGEAAGLVALVTAGPTREPVDPVRYLGNRSSGRMGFAVADALARRGARVALVAGPVALDTPPGVERIDVETAREMRDAVLARAPGADVFVSVAAVADYRVAEVAEQKIKKRGETLELVLVRNPDILREVAALPGTERPFCVGFAAETEALERHARAKLADKRLDLIAANAVADPEAPVFGSGSNALELFWGEGGHRSIPRADKARVAEALVDALLERRAATLGSAESRTPGPRTDATGAVANGAAGTGPTRA